MTTTTQPRCHAVACKNPVAWKSEKLWGKGGTFYTCADHKPGIALERAGRAPTGWYHTEPYNAVTETETHAVAMEFTSALLSAGFSKRQLAAARKSGHFGERAAEANRAMAQALARFYGRAPARTDEAVMQAAWKQAFADGFRYYQPHRADA